MHCPVCGSEMGPYKLKGMFRCPECTFITVDHTYTFEENKNLYNHGYFHGDSYANYTQERENIQLNVGNKLKIIEQLIAHPEEKRLFEIGCAYGFFLEMAAKQFKKVSGIDISEDAVRFAQGNGLDAAWGDFLSEDVRPQADVYCMWDTIEHLPEPVKFIEKIADLSAPGALLALTTGDIDTLNARVRGERWRLITPPYHLHYFSRTSITRLLESRGFEVKHFSHIGQWLGVDAILSTIFVTRMKREGMYKALRWTARVIPKVYLNFYDLMFVCAVKKP